MDRAWTDLLCPSRSAEVPMADMESLDDVCVSNGVKAQWR